VGVPINSAPTEGVLVTPFTQLKSTFPVLKNPANRHKAVGFTYDRWRYVFTNTFDETDARAAYERYHVPASGRAPAPRSHRPAAPGAGCRSEAARSRLRRD
jgi:hypothetical protein